MKVALFVASAFLFVPCVYAKGGSITIINNGQYVTSTTINCMPKNEDGDDEGTQSTGEIEGGKKGVLEIPDEAKDIYLVVEYRGFFEIISTCLDEPVTKCYTIVDAGLGTKFVDVASAYTETNC